MREDYYDDYRDTYIYSEEDSYGMDYAHYDDWYEVESAFCRETGYEPEIYED